MTNTDNDPALGGRQGSLCAFSVFNDTNNQNKLILKRLSLVPATVIPWASRTSLDPSFYLGTYKAMCLEDALS